MKTPIKERGIRSHPQAEAGKHGGGIYADGHYHEPGTLDHVTKEATEGKWAEGWLAFTPADRTRCVLELQQEDGVCARLSMDAFATQHLINVLEMIKRVQIAQELKDVEAELALETPKP